jgi:hypothetical protein
MVAALVPTDACVKRCPRQGMLSHHSQHSRIVGVGKGATKTMAGAMMTSDQRPQTGASRRHLLVGGTAFSASVTHINIRTEVRNTLKTLVF